MKTLTMLLLILAGFVAHASGYGFSNYDDLTWSQIEADSTKGISWPVIGGIPINEICLTQDKVRSLRPVTSCEQWQRSNAIECSKTNLCMVENNSSRSEGSSYDFIFYTCAKSSVKQNLELSRYVDVKTCTVEVYYSEGDVYRTINQSSCRDIKTERRLFPETHTVMITDYSESGASGTKEYSIPYCEAAN